MQIVTNQPDKLVLRSRSWLMGGALAAGALLAVVTVMGTAVWGLVEVSTQRPLPSYYGLRVILLLLVFALGVIVAWAGGTTAARVLRGVTCTFDRPDETVTVIRTDGFRSETRQHSLYGVSHALVLQNDEMRTLALYLVLRSGERIPLGVCSEYDADVAERFVQNVKGFLHRR